MPVGTTQSQARKTKQEINVFMLLESKAVAKEMSLAFRECNIVAHFFSNLKSFWKASLEEAPLLGIVDVRKMTDEELSITDHPKLKDETFPLVFYCDLESRPLLVSTYEIFHLGLLEGDGPFLNPLKAIVARANKIMLLQKEKERLLQYVYEEEANKKSLGETIIKAKNKIKSDKLIHELIFNSSKWKLETDFSLFCDKFLDQWDGVLEFAYWELSPNGQIMVAPDLKSEKYKKMQNINLPKASSEGLELSAQNLALEMAMEVLGEDSIPLLIQGEYKKPKNIVFIKAQKELAKILTGRHLKSSLAV